MDRYLQASGERFYSVMVSWKDLTKDGLRILEKPLLDEIMARVAAIGILEAELGNKGLVLGHLFQTMLGNCPVDSSST